ncbi:hypothetical protein Asp14428_16680 [Actinoplanes sp. NBRC 14428]|uniref:Uncharacterized protein (DUF2249 family) n=1 Tax=Pseudosporangium ferrugineum TaxID=439699 RepID=A0A2T0SB53_9ACTN|nr:DUF2249 domain-containing protein [Pseudosporangium ferrugineum]PRY30648.1 uncharacterized protein (DUF2249 family) [Pseudosporangium ferrugineum]BCJ50193.1 hypothetical protein Asp14428_16680 [Actinoplanes sp. NBRC 14428]
MSQSDPAADQQAAQAVVRHHGELAAVLTGHVTRLVEAADAGIQRQVWQRRGELTTWLHDELLPHAYAEEASLYPAAADLPAGKLLVDGMLGEHRVITALVADLESAVSPVVAAATAYALQAVFASHLAKENELVVPLLVGAGEVSLAGLLDGMHDIIGAESAPSGGGCGCGGCGCGGEPADAQAPALAIDPRLDVRDVPHGERHARVLAALDALPADGALVLVAPHAPLPLLAEIESRYAGQVGREWLQDGPDVWQIRLHRQPVPA